MDWDNDGNLDILSGCYWTEGKDGGHIQILHGKGGLDFAESESLLNASGEALQNIKIDNPDNKPIVDNQTEAICTEQHAVDYDGDGDLDLVVGCFANSFFLYVNEGNETEPKLGEPSLLPVASPAHHAAPHLADWDGDGDLDLLSGTSQGGVLISDNEGTRAKPVWSKFKQLVSPSNQRSQSVTADGPVAPAPSTRVWVTDWNRDGKLDLLVGDSVSLKSGNEDSSASSTSATTRTGFVWLYLRK